ncbi:ZIP family metal transporter [bacterium]|nr:ZIP family metal transporter [bacterium]
MPLSAGLFIYIAASDMIPELHKENEIKQSILQIALLVIGIAVML